LRRMVAPDDCQTIPPEFGAKKTPAKCGRFLLFGFGYGFKYSVTLTSATIASNVNAFINSRIY